MVLQRYVVVMLMDSTCPMIFFFSCWGGYQNTQSCCSSSSRPNFLFLMYENFILSDWLTVYFLLSAPCWFRRAATAVCWALKRASWVPTANLRAWNLACSVRMQPGCVAGMAPTRKLNGNTQVKNTQRAARDPVPFQSISPARKIWHFLVIVAGKNPWLCGTFLTRCLSSFIQWNCGNLWKKCSLVKNNEKKVILQHFSYWAPTSTISNNFLWQMACMPFFLSSHFQFDC